MADRDGATSVSSSVDPEQNSSFHWLLLLVSLVQWGPQDHPDVQRRTLDAILGSSISLTPNPFPSTP